MSTNIYSKYFHFTIQWHMTKSINLHVLGKSVVFMKITKNSSCRRLTPQLTACFRLLNRSTILNYTLLSVHWLLNWV